MIKITLNNKQIATRSEVELKGYTLLEEYEGYNVPLKMICPKGHYRECIMTSFRKYDCISCINENKLQIMINKIENKGYSFVNKPTNGTDDVVATCKNGHVRKTNLRNFLNHKCAECIGKSNYMNIQSCIDIFKKNGYDLLEEKYIDYNTPMKAVCYCGIIEFITMNALTKRVNKGCSKCRESMVTGENSHSWRGGVSQESEKARKNKHYKNWRNSIFERDNYTCQCCNVKGGKLNVHHIENFAENKNLRHSVHNGITLCERHHLMKYEESFHRIYGSSNNDIHQLQEYFDDTRSLLGLPPVDIIEDIIYKDYIFDIDKNS